MERIPYRLFLAPMAGITDHAFRAICMGYGAECCVTELISAKAVVYGDVKTASLAALYPDERPAAIQIFGSEPEIMARAAYELLKYSPAFIDINMGCPMPKLVQNGEGCALMRSPELCERIIKAVKNAVDVPVTAKIRRECDEGADNAPEIAEACESGGADMIFVHGRSRAQLYSGRADRGCIKRVKEAVNIPVIANGDIKSGADREEVLRFTGADGVMVGRGAYGSPWVFAEIKAYAAGETFEPPTDRQKRDLLLRQLDTVIADKGDRGVIEFRHHLLQYCKGFPGSAALRAGIASVKDRGSARAAIERVFG
ncbi:MAG: tRNA dihydrouridine synthase DusB [Clostridia bacterium]|nr:tRNA dihydrouridine synthase DusB [Clostridia bacterium]